MSELHIIPDFSGRGLYWVLRFDKRGQWKGAIQCENKADAQKERRKLKKRLQEQS